MFESHSDSKVTSYIAIGARLTFGASKPEPEPQEFPPRAESAELGHP